jgi:hypothetical protein
MATTTAADAAPAAQSPRRSLLGWYRRYYLLVNLPVLLLVTELALRRADLVHRFPFNDKDDLSKAFRSFDAAPPRPDDAVMLLFGNSATDRGFDPQAIEQAIGNPHLRIYNFGLKAARIDDERGLLELVRARGITPRAIVLGVNPYLLDDQVNTDTLYPWLQRRTPYLYFHRSRFRTKLWFWIKSLAKGAPKGAKPAKADRDADPVPEATTRISEAAIHAYVSEFDRRPAADYPMVGELADFIAWLEQQNIRTYVVILPMAVAGTSRVPEYEDLLAAIRAHVPAGSLDLSRAADKFPDELFYDIGHPNKAGRVVFTRELAAWLKTKPELAP